MADTAIKTRESNKVRLKEPPMFKVVVLNDDYTPIDFVVEMFMTVFKLSEQQSEKLAMTIHNEGSAVAGIYPYEIAEQKGLEATNLAREHGWPLVIKIESE